MTRENKNARKGIATFGSPALERASVLHERKQKRPQGHCDLICNPHAANTRTSGRENKNARKGIATNAKATTVY